jgi:hypothetical protein
VSAILPAKPHGRERCECLDHPVFMPDRDHVPAWCQARSNAWNPAQRRHRMLGRRQTLSVRSQAFMSYGRKEMVEKRSR